MIISTGGYFGDLEHIWDTCPEELKTMTKYEVQFELPVDNPVKNVSMRRGKGMVTFFVPINHPRAHNMGFQDLLDAQKESGLFKLSPTLNNKSLTSKKESSKPGE